MIDSDRSWHCPLVRTPGPLLTLTVILLVCGSSAACVEPEPGGEGGEGSEGAEVAEPGDLTETAGEACEPAAPGVSSTFSVSLSGFPEVVGDELKTSMSVEAPCTVEALSFDAGELSMSLACDHPNNPDGAQVELTTAAAGIPAGVELGSALTLHADAAYFESEGGDHSEPWRELSLADNERYALHDEAGVVFIGNIDALSYGDGSFGVSSEYGCDWEPCGDSNGPIRGFIRASVGEASIAVHVGEVSTLEAEGLAWDVSLFNSWLVVDCHNYDYGGFSVVRRPA